MLTWTDGRWHLADRGIHAGECLEIRWPDGTWERVRIESSDAGRKLFAYFDHHGATLAVRVDQDAHDQYDLRWPCR